MRSSITNLGSVAIPLCTAAKKGLGSLILLTLWRLWNERNNRIFRHEEVPVTRCIAAIKEDSRLWVFAGAKDLGSLVDPTSRK